MKRKYRIKYGIKWSVFTCRTCQGIGEVFSDNHRSPPFYDLGFNLPISSGEPYYRGWHTCPHCQGAGEREQAVDI